MHSCKLLVTSRTFGKKSSKCPSQNVKLLKNVYTTVRYFWSCILWCIPLAVLLCSIRSVDPKLEVRVVWKHKKLYVYFFQTFYLPFSCKLLRHLNLLDCKRNNNKTEWMKPEKMKEQPLTWNWIHTEFWASWELVEDVILELTISGCRPGKAYVFFLILSEWLFPPDMNYFKYRWVTLHTQRPTLKN